MRVLLTTYGSRGDVAATLLLNAVQPRKAASVRVNHAGSSSRGQGGGGVWPNMR